MSTADKVVANDTFPNVRADLNAQLAAIAGQQSGTADPAAMLPYERQARTDLGVARRRNAANGGWVLDGTLAEAFVLARSSNTILGLANHLCTIIATGTFTQTLDAAATLGDGWHVNYRNDGTGVITLDPNGAETIDGAATLALNPGESCVIVCNGAALKTIGGTQSRMKIGSFTRDATTASGTQAITGVGFTPKAVMLIAAIDNSVGHSVGFAAADGSRSVFQNNPGGTDLMVLGGSFAIGITVSGGTGTMNQGAVSSFDADGFTITWTKVGAPSGTITAYYLAMR